MLQVLGKRLGQDLEDSLLILGAAQERLSQGDFEAGDLPAYLHDFFVPLLPRTIRRDWMTRRVYPAAFNSRKVVARSLSFRPFPRRPCAGLYGR